ncbi:hypothetical protein NMY22_g3250 [Coprinellus aureogranulatus]|nr:hypothetical protein NMY22_g3250 [Coprinellus aureogranulatus]
MPKFSETPLPLGIGQHRQKRRTTAKLLCLVSLLSLSFTLSSILPTPWTFLRVHDTSRHVLNDPESEWRDDEYPLHQQTPWDISTDFDYPRKLEYDVTEGTWLRLDVHPNKSGGRAEARPVTGGVPHDSDPRFSPEGDRLVFRSDAGHGVENIWVMEWEGVAGRWICARWMSLRIGLRRREGLEVCTQRVTNETYRYVSDARFHPSGSKVVATKWYTSSRSLGAGEGWEYPIPSLDDLRAGKQHKVGVQSGKRLLGRTLPPGWTAEDYGDQQIGPEQILWSGNDTLIFSKNVVDSDTFTYSKDVHSGIYAIFQTNLTSQTTTRLVDSFPGGASRPELSRDGRTLAFVRRVRDKQALVLKDLVTGTIHNIWYGLTYDLTTVSAPMGTYPSFAFTPSDDAIIIWAAGQIHKVPLTTNAQGEKVASLSESPYPVPFKAHIVKRLAQTLRGGATDLRKLEQRESERVRAFRGLRVDHRGEKVVFTAAGVTYLHDVYERDTLPVPVSDPSAPYYSPTFVAGYDDLVLHAKWDDTNLTSFEIADVAEGKYSKVEGLPMGRYFSPVICECKGWRRQMAFVKSAGDGLSGNIVATANPGIYVGDIDLKGVLDGIRGGRHRPALGSTVSVSNLTFIPSEVNTNDPNLNIRFLEGNKKLLVRQSRRNFIIDLSAGLDTFGKYSHTTLAEGKISQELAVSVHKKPNGSLAAERIAFVDAFQIYLAHGDLVKEGEAVWSKPGNATEELARVSVDGGHDLAWSGDGKKLFWLLGPYLHAIEAYKIPRCSAAIHRDRRTFGIDCIKDLLYYQEVVVTQPTHIAQARRGARSGGTDSFVVYNATLLTMATGKLETDLVKDSVLTIRGGEIHSIDTIGSVHIDDLRAQGTVVDAAGGFVVPGFIDVHAHWDGFSSRFPAKSWEMETFLAYGVTTLHNPSADNVDAFTERSRVEAGYMVGPRIFSVGTVVYGAAEPGVYQDVTDLEEARSVLRRIKAEGGEYAISYKNYNIPSRASRQRLLLAARNLSMLCVPEGGMNYDWDLTYIIDGMTTVEHALPIPTLYDDVLTLYALSGTGSTPTHVVNYGGAWGEQFVWATEDVPNDPKLRKFTRHDILEALSESTARPRNSYAFFNTSTSVAKMVHKGLRAHIGAHGEPPLGLNYHAEMEFTRAGGLTRYETLRAATIDAAVTLGLQNSIGSLEPGKLADFVVYPPHVNVLREDGDESSASGFTTVGPTRDILFVGRAGRVWNAETMEEVWPVRRPRQRMPVINAD